ncbi:hypothetical protein [Stenotrophomonas hibiscicola]|uniref:hypothetical protein n=1 Tax=Stenotrophomonas hibiscicola TaxID=86189 RepID=UPI0012ACB330|nr:hypothetical protein [[Pseudomonas] hibiscicola]
MNKHTKGPWVIVRGDEWTTDIATVEGELPDGRPAHWNVASVNKQRDEWEYNRRLIAAAPELLEALIRLEAELVEDKYGECYEPSPFENLALARAAIAKATGEA